MARIFVTGGTGALGRLLVPLLLAGGHEVLALARRGDASSPLPPGAIEVRGEPTLRGGWWDGVESCDAAVNLAGEPILGRWTAEKKRRMEESRFRTTENLVERIPGSRPFTLLSASAVGYYGDAGERLLAEDAPAGSGFLASLAAGWEARALEAGKRGARVALLRFGVMVGPGPGPLAEMLKNSARFGGGMAGRGSQYLSWISRRDAAAAVLFLLANEGLAGPVNVCSPNPLTHREANDQAARLTGRPPFVSIPALAVRLALGEFADAILFGQRMVPAKLLKAGFAWRDPFFGDAVEEALGRVSPA